MTTSGCPCGSSLDPCCVRYHAGEPAPTAEALMRSRYTAYINGEIDYLIATHASTTTIDRAALVEYCATTKWHGLEIVGTVHGGPYDTSGYVEFIARGETNGKQFEQCERSRFRKSAGRWFYVDGKRR